MYTFTTRTLSNLIQKSSTIPGRPKVVGTLKLHHVSPISTNIAFFQQKGNNLLIINIKRGGREELASCFNSYGWDCRR